MARNIQTTVTILGKDQLSPVVTTAATRSINELTRLQKKASAVSSGAFEVSRISAGVGTAIAAPLILAGREAVKFEEKMVGLGKVANMDVGSKGLNQLGEDAKKAAYYLATLPSDVSASMKNLKQAGASMPELGDVTIFSGESAVAFDLAAAHAGEAFGSIRAAMGLTVKETKIAFDSINELSNNMGATPERLISFFTAGGAGAAGALKMRAAEIAAYGATFIQAGKSGEEAATIVERISKNIFSKKPLAKIYDSAGGGNKGLLAVLNAGANLKGETKIRKYFAQFGEFGLDVRRLAENMNGPGGLTGALKLVASEEKFAGAVHREFASVQKSTMAQIRKEWVGFQVAVIDFGTAALPTIKSLVSEMKGVLNVIGPWIKANPDLAAGLFKGAAGLAAFTFGVSAISGVIGAGAKAFSAYTTVAKFFSTGTGAAAISGVWNMATAVGGLATTTTILGAPLWFVAGVIGVAGYAAYKAYEHFESFHEMVLSLTTAIQSLSDHAGPMMSKLFSGDFKGAWGEMKAANMQTQLNVAAGMQDFRKNKPALGPTTFGPYDTDRPEMIANRRAYQTKEAERKMLNPSQVGTPGLLDRMGLGVTPKSNKWNNVPKPNSVPAVQGGTSISVTNNPIFNVNGSLTPESKQEMLKLSSDSQYNLMRMLQQAQNNANRVSLE